MQTGLIEYLSSFLVFLNNVIIPFLIALAIVLLIIGFFRFFILGGANEQERDKGKRLAIYGILGLVFILIFWGVVALGVNTFGLGGEDAPCPDVFGGSSSWCP